MLSISIAFLNEVESYKKSKYIVLYLYIAYSTYK